MSLGGATHQTYKIGQSSPLIRDNACLYACVLINVVALRANKGGRFKNTYELLNLRALKV